MKNIEKYAPIVLRYGIVLVFLWFGYNLVTNPAKWIGMLPAYTATWNQTALIIGGGIAELILAALLALGYFVRPVAVLLSLHLLHIISLLGYGPTAVRDFGLMAATVSIALHGNDDWCLGKRK